MAKYTEVKTSRPHRRKKHDRRGGEVRTSKPFRIKTYKRRARRTDAQIAASRRRKK